MDKSQLSERDICSKFIAPALQKAGWDMQRQVREEVTFTDGRIIVQGKMHARGQRKRADYILYHQPNQPLAIIEAKDNNKGPGAGMQQALEYAAILDLPFVFTSNGDSFVFHDHTQEGGDAEQELALADFPSPDKLWQKYLRYKGLEEDDKKRIVEEPFHFDDSPKSPRYYQQIAINRTVEAIAKGQPRILLVMATGTGKTFTAFHIIWRLWKSETKKRILFLADRNALLDQTKNGDFAPFGSEVMHIIKNRRIDKSFQIYFALYQGLTGNEEIKNVYKNFSPGFFDLIVVDEC
ncbi:MAG: DEAD/DEAH box helicase family protein, partial [Schleiferiaceae bacterium]|nr:DEAD/DEAH box helicase family protein [Schleiferiaceae bacterium]